MAGSSNRQGAPDRPDASNRPDASDAPDASERPGSWDDETDSSRIGGLDPRDIEENLLGGPLRYTREQVEERSGIPAADVRAIWQALGFP
ncbi:hypothetical protein ACFQ07_00045, partial [Actinomadura adrarensis]